MSGNPTVIVSYSGVLGGAERILLDCATRLGEPVVVACPEGAAGEPRCAPPGSSTRAAGAAAAPRRRPRPRARRPGSATCTRWRSAGVRPRSSPGAPAPCSPTAPLRRRPPLLAVHMDLLPRRGVGAAVRWATPSRRRRGRRVGGDRGAPSRRRRDDPAPRRRPRALRRLRPPRTARRGRSRSPRSCRGSARTSRSRSPRACPGSGSSWPERRSPATTDAFVRELEARAAARDLAGRVTFLGPVADPREALARAHCLLHCADAEPWGLALVEALAAGRPVVAADAGGPREIVADGAGRLFPPGDADAAAAALQEVLADPAAPAAARARARAVPGGGVGRALPAALEAIRRDVHRRRRPARLRARAARAARLARAPPGRAAAARGGRQRLVRRRRRARPRARRRGDRAAGQPRASAPPATPAWPPRATT